MNGLAWFSLGGVKQDVAPRHWTKPIAFPFIGFSDAKGGQRMVGEVPVFISPMDVGFEGNTGRYRHADTVEDLAAILLSSRWDWSNVPSFHHALVSTLKAAPEFYTDAAMLEQPSSQPRTRQVFRSCRTMRQRWGKRAEKEAPQWAGPKK
ncbi:hypothetical protein [Rhizobium mesoamericanum]|uniref:hypothetical protein n=1 Tax=Rhizobium mesoamericanum TaxID=1079800 RepID=UPI001F31C4F1|nr:hypothetical protein [Rhizobium mesoamericanum]